LSGLAGLFIIDDNASFASGMPSDYGVDDLPIVLQDRFLDSNGRIQLVEGDNVLGTIGDTLLVNGISGTHFVVTTALALAATHEREHERATASVLPERHGPLTLVG